MDDFNTNLTPEATPSEPPVQNQTSEIPTQEASAQQEVAPEFAPPRTPYDAGSQQPLFAPQYNTAPLYKAPSGFNPNVIAQPKKKESKNTGKFVFIGLVCLCVAVACVVVALGLRGNGDTVINSDNSRPTKGDSTATEAVAEDSPVSYSEYSGKGKMTAEQVYASVKDINVGILVYAQNQKVGEGSGIIVGENKDKTYTYILTAAHVIADQGVSIQVQFNDESEISATVVGLDEKTDIGVLRIKKTGLKAATFGNSSKLSVGQTVYAIGNPGGTEFFGSFTSGMISAIDRPVPTTNSSYDLPCIQHNAAINPGNSGGALVNEYGQVIGLNSSKISSTEYEGMGFAVPGETMLEIYNELIKNGYVSNRPMLGITYYAVSSDYQTSMIAYRNGLPYGSVVIATLSNSSDLINHGIKAGDIITAVNGKKLDSTDVLLEAIEDGKVGDKLTLSICRISTTGAIETTFDATIKLVEDTGDNGAPQPTQEPTTQNPYSSYFENFGY